MSGKPSVNRPPTPPDDENLRADKELTLQEAISLKLIQSGEKERLKELLRERLLECGWRDDLRAQCRSILRRKGLGNVAVDELVQEITPRGRATIPGPVKAELLNRIRNFLADMA
eukprot:jgi/Mesvir1/12944/Mv05959-RA.1